MWSCRFSSEKKSGWILPFSFESQHGTPLQKFFCFRLTESWIDRTTQNEFSKPRNIGRESSEMEILILSKNWKLVPAQTCSICFTLRAWKKSNLYDSGTWSQGQQRRRTRPKAFMAKKKIIFYFLKSYTSVIHRYFCGLNWKLKNINICSKLFLIIGYHSVLLENAQRNVLSFI